MEDKQLSLPSMEEQAAIEGNPTKLQTWTYKPANALMYVRHRRKIIICSLAYGKFTEFTFLFLDLRSSNGCFCIFLSCRVIVSFFSLWLTVFELDVVINWACLERNCIVGYSLTCHDRPSSNVASSRINASNLCLMSHYHVGLQWLRTVYCGCDVALYKLDMKQTQNWTFFTLCKFSTLRGQLLISKTSVACFHQHHTHRL